LKQIVLEDLILYYENIEDKKVIFVMATDSSEKERKIREKMGLIEDAFFCEFEQILPEWKCDITEFQKFNEKVDEILSNRGRHVPLPDFDIIIRRESIEKFLKKFVPLFKKNTKEELIKLEKTMGLLDRICKMKYFSPPNLVIEASSKIQDAIEQIITKISKKKKREKKNESEREE